MKNVLVQLFIRRVQSLLLGVALISLLTPGQLAGRQGRDGKPKSIILFIADGMGIGQHTIAYYQLGRYPLDQFQHVGLMTTHPLDKKQVTESGASATAMSTGWKTNRAVLGMDATGKPLLTALEVAEAAGKVTGLVTTAAITDATPAAFAAHYPNRNHPEIVARQMTAAGIEVLLGGGRSSFGTDDDGNDLIATLKAGGTQVIFDLDTQLAPGEPLLGLFAPGEMPAPPERSPTLIKMVRLALDRLDNHKNGFFLMVEEEGTDTQSHRNNLDGVLGALEDVMNTVDLLLEFQTAHPEVLLIFTGDHETGGFYLLDDGSRPAKHKWVTRRHTGNMIPIFASGPGSAAFDGILDNTDVGKLLIKYLR